MISAIAGEGSRISSRESPASGEPWMPRGQSPQASVVVRPTASRRRQISGTSSMRIQWYCTFSRSPMSAESRANSVETWPRVRSVVTDIGLPSERTRIMKYLASIVSRFSSPVHEPS